MYSDRESRGSKSGRLEYDTFPRECGFRSDIRLPEKQLHGHPLQFNERADGQDNVRTLRQRASYGRRGSEKAKDSRHNRHTFETNVDSQDRPRSWNTEHRARGYDSRRESTNPIVAGGQVRMNDNNLDKQIVLERDLHVINTINRRQQNLDSTGPFKDDDWRGTRSNFGAASNDRSTLLGRSSSRSETSEGVASAPSSHSLRRQSTREERSRNKSRDQRRSSSPEPRPSRAESSSLKQKRHRTDDERSSSTDRDTKRKKKEKGKLKDSAEKRSVLTGKKIKLKVKKDKSDRERDANRKELLQFLNSAYE